MKAFMSKEKISKEEATSKLMASFSTARSRRSLLKGAVTASGITLAGIGALNALPARASMISNGAGFGAAQGLGATRSTAASADSIASILSIARTAEQLAVTFYSNGLNNATMLGITGDELDYLKAALVEEQIHQQFFTANGGQSIATTFSFPKGRKTFTDLKTFIDTQQQLEGVFDSAFLAAIKEFAQLGRPDLAQIAGQIACIEAEHRALGRVIGKLSPADNWAFTPVLIATVGDAPALVKKAGYLSPESGNSYTYQEVSTDDAGVEQRKPFSVSSTAVGNG